MGLFDRFKRVVKSNINDMISKAENPEKMLNQLIIEMNEQLFEAKKAVAMAIADEKKLERQMNEYLPLGLEWENRARTALKSNREDLAKDALIRKAEYDNLAEQYRLQLEGQRESVGKLKIALRMLQQKIEEAQRKKNLLIARAKRAEAQKKIQETMGNLSDTSAFEAFDKMAAKVDMIEAEADAIQELNDYSRSASLEKQIEALEPPADKGNLLLEEFKKKEGLP